MEAHQTLLLARVRHAQPKALDARAALRLATTGGAECLGRDDCGLLEPRRCADIACFRVDDLAHAGIRDLLAGLVLAPPARAETVVVNGQVVVREGRLLTGDESEITRDVAAASARLDPSARNQR
jgi:cytosine/adenosine deaminase-related metal-dependent hydrolase